MSVSLWLAACLALQNQTLELYNMGLSLKDIMNYQAAGKLFVASSQIHFDQLSYLTAATEILFISE